MRHLAYRLARGGGGRRACKQGGGIRQVTVSALCTVHGELWGVPYRGRGGWGCSINDEILKNDKKSYVVYCRDDLVPDSSLIVIVRGFVVSQDLLIGWWSDCSEHEILDVIRNVHLLLPLLLLWRRVIRLWLVLLLRPKNKSFNSYKMDWTSKPLKFECKLIKTKFT